MSETPAAHDIGPVIAHLASKPRAPYTKISVPVTARDHFAVSLPDQHPKRSIMELYDKSPELAESVRDEYSAQANPSVPEELLLQLQEAGCLWMSWVVGRDGVGGSNSMIYRFYLSPTTSVCVGEWHVHWLSQKRAGNPGWKVGRSGDRVGGDDLEVMRKLIGPKRWGEVVGFGGSRPLAGE